MKSLIISFFFLFIYFPISCDRDQTSKTLLPEEKFIGTWSFCSVDSCFQYVIPNPETYRSTISHNTGRITFLDDGTGSLTSHLVLYCNYGSFIWQYKSNTLSIYASDSYSNLLSSDINFIAEDTMSIKLHSCIPRRGIRIWYEIISSKNIVK
jgi:hypothetical protein